MSSQPPKTLFYLNYGSDNGVGLSADDPALSPYGYGYCADYLTISMSQSRPESKLRTFLRRGAAHVLGFDVLHAMSNRTSLASADVVVTHTEHEHLAVAALMKLRLIPRTPLVGQSVWLWDEWNHLDPLRSRLYRWLLEEVTVHTTLSRKNASVASRTLGRPVYFVPYGADTQRFPPTSAPASASEAFARPGGVREETRVVAAGNDRHRDWSTLVQAARSAPHVRVTIVSRRLRARLAALRCGRVSVVRTSSSEEMKRLLAQHDVVAVPLHPNLHASGITVAYEAIFSSVPAVVTRTGGLDDYLDGLVHWADPHDAKSLLAAVRAGRRAKDDVDRLQICQSSLIDRGLTISDFGLRHVLAVWFALGLPVDSSLMSAFEPVRPMVDRMKSELALQAR